MLLDPSAQSLIEPVIEEAKEEEEKGEFPPQLNLPRNDKILEDLISGVIRDLPDQPEEEEEKYPQEEKEVSDEFIKEVFGELPEPVEPTPEEWQQIEKKVRPQLKPQIAKEIEDDLVQKILSIKKDMKDNPLEEILQYEEFLKQQVKEGTITKNQAKKDFKTFQNDINKSDPRYKRMLLLQRQLNDKDYINELVENSKKIAEASAISVLFKQPKRDQAYFDKKLGKVREELSQKQEKYLIDDPDNPEMKKLNPDIDLGQRENKSYRGENFELTEFINKLVDERQKDKSNKSQFLSNIFLNKEDLLKHLNEFNGNIDFIDKSDKYLIKGFIDKIFDIKDDGPIPIIFDIENPERNKVIIAQENITYIIEKYIKDIPDEKTRKVMIDNIISYIIKDLITNYYVYNEDKNVLEYTDYINNFIEDTYSKRNKKGNEGYEKDLKTIPSITLIKNRLDKIDTQNITLQDKLDVAELWNSLYKKNEDFSKIWTYMGFDKENYYGRSRGSVIYDKLFERNPYFSMDHNLFAIGDIKEALKRKEKIKDVEKAFIQNNKAFFKSKGETLTQQEAQNIFDEIIKSLNKKKGISVINTLSSTRGSGVSKREILKHLKGNSPISKPNTKDLDTAIFKILNS